MKKINLHRKLIIRSVLQLVCVAAVFVLAFYTARYLSSHEGFSAVAQRFGYIGALVVSFVAGLNIAIPVPAISFLPLFTESGLDVMPVLIIFTIGTTLADSVSYLIGRAGRNLVSPSIKKWERKLERLRERYSYGPLIALTLWAAAMPLPNEVLVIPLAVIGYKYRHMLPFLILGNAIFNIAATYGILNLVRLFL